MWVPIHLLTEPSWRMKGVCGGVEWVCRRSARSPEIRSNDLCPCVESKKKKKTAKRATRKLGQVLKDHCSPFSPGLRCIQNCNLTVAPSISSAFLLFSSGKFSPRRSPFSGRETIRHWYAANVTVGGLLWLRQILWTAGVPEESLNKAKVCMWNCFFFCFFSTVCSGFVRGIMGWLKRLCTFICIIEEGYFNWWSTPRVVQSSSLPAVDWVLILKNALFHY